MHLRSQLQFLTISAKHEKTGSVQGAQGGRIGGSAAISHVHNPDSSFPRSNRVIFWRGFSTQEELQITHHQ